MLKNVEKSLKISDNVGKSALWEPENGLFSAPKLRDWLTPFR